jgi:hypothetical protein
MELLDAAIALAITLAALATTVTVLMEIWIRFFGLKSKTQVELFQKIFDNAVKDKFPGQLNRWDFVKKVLRNPLLAGEMREPKPGAYTPYVGRSQGIYEWVSDEHVYRRLLGMQGVLAASKAELVSKLKQFSRKYDELCGAASVEFKANRRRWSIIAGVLLAIVLNIDGIRIFNEYVKRPELAAAMAAKADELERTAQRAEERLEDVMDEPGKGGIAEIEKRLEELNTSIADLETAGVPIGWRYPPHCLVLPAPESQGGSNGNKGGGGAAGGGEKANACRLEEHRQSGGLVWIGSIIAMLGTGVLIGLGAPFWFDVARRLAEVRSFFGGKGGGEAAYTGETAGAPQPGKTKSERTDALINRVVEEALTEHRPTGVRRLLVERSDV